MTEEPQQAHKTTRLVKVIREVISVVFWSFTLVKIFVVDVDVLILQRFLPNYSWVFKYKFFVFFGLLAASWLIVGNKVFRNSVLYVLGYPLVILFYHLPRLFFKNWTLAFLLLPSLVSLFKSFKVRFISTSFALVACLLIVLHTSEVLSILSMATLFIYLGIHYAMQFRRAYSGSSFFRDVSKFTGRLWTSLKETLVLKELKTAKTLPLESEEYGSKRSSILFNLLFFNRLFLFSTLKLKRIQESRVMDIYLIGTLLYTFVVTVVVFAFEYLGLFHLLPQSFSGSSDRSFFFFLYASFNTLLTVGFGDFVPVGVIARLFTSLELFSWILIFLILFFTITTIIRERYHQDVNSLIQQLASEGAGIEDLILQEYQLSVPDAKDQIKKNSPQLMKLIDYFKSEE